VESIQQKNPEGWGDLIEAQRKLQVSMNLGMAEIIRRAKSRERMPFGEIQETWLRHVPPNSIKIEEEDVVDLMEHLIDNDEIKGFLNIEQKEFVNMSAYRQTSKVVQYNIASSFDFSDGIIKITCPSCGSPNIQKEKRGEGKCAHCGTTYIIPNKILEML
jgi:predicted RNA-binding Zn-ribbon protein involved in translation (DUF1610 family)